MKKILSTMDEMLAELKSHKIDFNKSTFEYYQELGLLPKPIKQTGKGGRGVYNLYETKTVGQLVKHIYELKDRGYKLLEIKEELKKETIGRGREALSRQGYRDIISGTLKYDTRNLSCLRLPMDIERTNDKLTKVDEAYRKQNEASLAKELRWWDPTAAYEEAALAVVSHTVYGAIDGLKEALSVIAEHMKKEEEKDWAILVDVSIKLQQKLGEALDLEENILNRLNCLDETNRKT